MRPQLTKTNSKRTNFTSDNAGYSKERVGRRESYSDRLLANQYEIKTRTAISIGDATRELSLYLNEMMNKNWLVGGKVNVECLKKISHLFVGRQREQTLSKRYWRLYFRSTCLFALTCHYI